MLHFSGVYDKKGVCEKNMIFATYHEKEGLTIKQRILVVEDEIQIAKILKIELEYEGYEVVVAYDGKRGLEAALQEKLDLILLDVMLPELNGIEVLRRIRKENNFIPIILLTARNLTMDKVTGLDQGANDYITKPFEMEELLARVRSCLRQNSIAVQVKEQNDSCYLFLIYRLISILEK